MTVNAFTVEGEVILKTENFDSAISKLVNKLEELKTGLSNLGINTQSFTSELARADLEMTKAYENIEKIDSSMINTAREMGKLQAETSEFSAQLTNATENVSTLKNTTNTLVYDFNQVTTATTKAAEQVQILTNEFSSMRYYVDMVKASEEALYQIEKKRMDSLTALQSAESERIQSLQKRIDYLHMEEQQMQANASIQKDIILRLEREEQKRQEIMQNTLDMGKRELHYLEQQHQAELGIYDDIVKRYEVQGRFVNAIQEQLDLLSERNAIEQENIAFLDEQMTLVENIQTLIQQGGAENIKQADALMKQLQSHTELYTALQEEIDLTREQMALEEEKLAIERETTAELTRQNATRTRGNNIDKMGYLPRRILSMGATMLGYKELMDIYDKVVDHINAVGKKDYFQKRLNMDAEATQNFTNKLKDLQQEYVKVDMTAVGADALETASKYKVQSKDLGQLTEVMATYSSEFVRQGRSQGDAILAVNDALDGELRRLKEVGIGAKDLEATGLWSGDFSDKSGMIKALDAISEDRGYKQTAKDVTNLSDALTALEVKLGIDLAKAFGVIEPLIVDVLGNFTIELEDLEKAIAWVTPRIVDLAKALGLLDKDGKATKLGNFLESWVSWFIALGITLYGVYRIGRPVLSWFGKIKDLVGGIGKGAEEVGTTGGTVASDIEKGGWKGEFKKLGTNLAKMARVFIEVAVAMVGAFALIEEAIFLISEIGTTYDSMKPQFDKGAQFIHDFGLWFVAAGASVMAFSVALSKVPDNSITKGALTLAKGVAVSMGIIAEAIFLLNAPLLAIASLGADYNWQESNIETGMDTIRMFGDAINYIANDDTLRWFVIGLVAISAVIGVTADTVAIPLVAGVAAALLIVAEAIVMLNAPLLAIAGTGAFAQKLGQANIQAGAEALKIVGQALKTIADAVPSLLIVDLGVLGQELIDIGSEFLSGKDGLTYLSDEIIPSLSSFVEKFNNVTINPINTTTLTNLSQVASQIPVIKRNIDTIRNSVGTGGTGGFNILGFNIGADTSSLKPKLDILYNSIVDVMDFAKKLGGLSSGKGANGTTIQQMSNAIVQLNAKLNSFITTIDGAATKVQGASNRLGAALSIGFKVGSALFSTTVVSVLEKGISEVQRRYNTFNNAGKTSGQRLVDGFKNHNPSLRTIVSDEIRYALDRLDDAKGEFYSRGQALGEALHSGFESRKGLNVGSPAKIANAITREMEYSMLALDAGTRMMYRGGQALGEALMSGYNNGGSLRTDIGILASKGINNKQLQANEKTVQVSDKDNKKKQEITQNNINIDMSGSTIIGVQDLDNKIKQAVEKAIVSINSPNGAIGY